MYVCSHWIWSFIKHSKWLEGKPFTRKGCKLSFKGIDTRSQRNARPLSKSRGSWSFLVRPLAKKPECENESFGQWSDSDADAGDLDSIEFRRFEVLRSELMELEKRVKESADQSKTEEEIKVYDNEVSGAGLTAPKKGNVIKKSLDKLKETSMDVWQRTQLLTIDVAVAMGLMRRVIIGDELTEKEKSGLRRTVTDLASIVPIGVLMFLPMSYCSWACSHGCDPKICAGTDTIYIWASKAGSVEETAKGEGDGNC